MRTPGPGGRASPRKGLAGLDRTDQCPLGLTAGSADLLRRARGRQIQGPSEHLPAVLVPSWRAAQPSAVPLSLTVWKRGRRQAGLGSPWWWCGLEPGGKASRCPRAGRVGRWVAVSDVPQASAEQEEGERARRAPCPQATSHRTASLALGPRTPRQSPCPDVLARTQTTVSHRLAVKGTLSATEELGRARGTE